MSKKETKNKESYDEGPLREIKVRVVGVGGGGGSIISGISSSLKRVLFTAANTDSHALQEVTRKKKIKSFHFGAKITGGLGTGMDPHLGREAANGSIEEVKELFKGQDIVILVASLGGGTGSGALPIFASAARKTGSIVYGVFTLPFSFEGEKKMNISRKAIKETAPYLNAITILPNDKIFKVVDKSTPLKDALSKMNEMLAFNLEGLIETIHETGLINIDFADVRTVLDKRKGSRKLTYLSTTDAELQDGADEIVRKAVSNPLYPYKIEDARGVLFNITGGKDIGLMDVASISENISKYTNMKAKIIVGITQKKGFSNKVRIALLATGCGTDFFAEELGEKKKPVRKKKVKKKEPPKEPVVKKEEKKEEIRSSAMDVKNKLESEEKRIIEEEDKWDKPSFLRREND